MVVQEMSVLASARVRRRRFLISGLAVVTTACGLARQSPPAPTATPLVDTVVRPTPADVRLGAALPLSGWHADVGAALKLGYELAIEDVNAGGGVPLAEHGVRVGARLMVYDDQGHAETTRHLCERLAGYDRVDALLGGHAGSASARAAVAELHGVPYVTGSEAEAEPLAHRAWAFGPRAPDSRLAGTQLDWLAWCQERGLLRRPARLVVVSESTPSGAVYRSDLETRADPTRFELLVMPAFGSPAIGDHRALLRELRELEPDVLLARVSLEDTIVLQRQAGVILRPAFVSFGFHGHELAARAQLGKAADRLVGATWWTPALASEPARSLARRVAERTGSPAEWRHAYAYSAARIVLGAIGRAGATAPSALREALAGGRHPAGVLPGGEVSFGADGRAELPLLLVQNVPGGEPAIVWPPELRTGEPVAVAR